ncbi:MAG: glycosyltransferase [Trueperaceae bacterium]
MPGARARSTASASASVSGRASDSAPVSVSASGRASDSAPSSASASGRAFASAPASPASIEISVLTVTFGRSSALSQKLDSLARQTLDPARFELILCVNDDPDTWQAVQEARPPYRLTTFAMTPRRAAAAARNACAGRARGQLLYLSDDDAVLEPDTLERHVSAHRGLNRPALVVGGIDFVGGAETIRKRPERVHYWNANGVNTSLPRAAFERVGGFPEWLTGYGFEDVVLGYELNRAGLEAVALPDAVVRHLGPDPMRGADLDKARQAGRSAMVVARRIPELAYRVGAHPLLMAFKRILLASPLRGLWGGAAAYEAAFLEGALEARTNGAGATDVAAPAEGRDDDR